MKLFQFLCFSIVVLPFFSCAARVSGSLAADGSGVMSVDMALQPRITSLIRTFAAAGGQTDGVLLDGPAIASSMENAPGIASISFQNTSSAAIEGTIRISNINDFLSSTDGAGFIVFEQTGSGGKLSININRENSPQVLGLLSPEIAVYLEALMAPIATGEELGKEEYLDLVGSIYNRAIANEITSSRFYSSIEFPGTITNTSGGTHSGRTAEFNIPLLDILVLEEPLNYEVMWQ